VSTSAGFETTLKKMLIKVFLAEGVRLHGPSDIGLGVGAGTGARVDTDGDSDGAPEDFDGAPEGSIVVGDIDASVVGPSEGISDGTLETVTEG
jgi:hypothetical protein